MEEYNVLQKISDTSDLKKLTMEELKLLTNDVRNALFNKLCKKGGHFGSNFGTVELTIALHFVFDSPKDKIVFDVSHQSYTHKILTGRKQAFLDIAHFSDITGFTNPDESEHDLFKIGHTSTSISLATGIAKVRDMKKEKFNVISIIGDASLSGGEAYEGLDTAGSDLNSNFIVIVNDNDQSVAESHGAIAKHLTELRNNEGKCENNIFKCLGFEYRYLKNGNDVEKLVKLFSEVKNIDKPIVLHINTKKGCGYKIAEENKEDWHWCYPFNRETGEYLEPLNEIYYADVLGDYIMDRAKKDKSFLFITPSYPGGVSLTPERRKALSEKIVDVGIAEQQAVTMASGAAKCGMNVLISTDASFFQRTYDQISHDLCINNNPATILVNYTCVGCEDTTHLGIFLIPMLLGIPNLRVLYATCKSELEAMLDWSLNQKKYSVAVIAPRGVSVDRKTSYDFDKLNYYIEKDGKNIAVISLGGFYNKGVNLVSKIKNELNIDATLINPRFISELDIDLLNNLKNKHKLVITLEDVCVKGGFGEKIAAFYGNTSMNVLTYGYEKKFYDFYDEEHMEEKCNITNDKIIEDIKKIYS